MFHFNALHNLGDEGSHRPIVMFQAVAHYGIWLMISIRPQDWGKHCDLLLMPVCWLDLVLVGSGVIFGKIYLQHHSFLVCFCQHFFGLEKSTLLFFNKTVCTNFVAAVLRKLSTSPSVPLFWTLFGNPSVVSHEYQVTFICLSSSGMLQRVRISKSLPFLQSAHCPKMQRVLSVLQATASTKSCVLWNTCLGMTCCR